MDRHFALQHGCQKPGDVIPSTQIHRAACDLLFREELRDSCCLHLTANENRLSPSVQRVLSSGLASRYHLGTPADYADAVVQVVQDRFTFRSLSWLHDLEAMAADVFRRRLYGGATEFRALSGLHAMICTIVALTEPGDVVLSINPQRGGHFATGNLVRSLGRQSLYVDFDRASLTLSLAHLEELAAEHRIVMAFLDEGNPLYALPFRQIRDILGPRTLIVYDASHTLGLILGGRFARPIPEGCDVVQGNSHKTFPGPQKAIIHFADATLAGRAAGAIGDALVSSQHTHHAAALYLSALEMDLFGRAYAAQTVANAKRLSLALRERGFGLLEAESRPTDTHLLLVQPPEGLTSVAGSERLMSGGVVVNAKSVYGYDLLRVGVQEVTRRGMTESDMDTIAELFEAVLIEQRPDSEIRVRVHAIQSAFPHIHYSFDAPAA